MDDSMPLRASIPMIGISVVTCLTMWLCSMAYPEPYLFWEYEISALGASVSVHGLPNTIAMYIFIAGFVVNVLLCIIGSMKVDQPLIATLFIVMGAGMGAIAFPMDLYVDIHRIGAMVMFICMWIILSFGIIRTCHFASSIGVIGMFVINLLYLMYSFHLLIGNNAMWQKIAFLDMMGMGIFMAIMSIASSRVEMCFR